MPAHDSGWKWLVTPSSRRTHTGYFPPVSLALPAGLVGMAQRRLVLVREDRIGHRLEQRHEALQAVGQRPRRDRQPLAGHPRGNPVQEAEAGAVFEQEARPEAGPVERSGEQPRRRGRRHFDRRRRAAAGPAPPGAPDDAFVGLDLDLDEGGFVDTVGDISLPATGAYTRLLRRNLSTTLRHRRFLFTDSFLLLWKWRVG